MNPITFEQIVAAVSFIGLVATLLNTMRTMNAASKQRVVDDALKLDHISRDIKDLSSDIRETNSSLLNFMGRTDETISTIKETLSLHEGRIIKVEGDVRHHSEELNQLRKNH